MGNKIASLQHAYLASLSTWAEGVQCYWPSRTYATIPYFPLLAYWALSAEVMQFYWPSLTYVAITYCSIFFIFSSLCLILRIAIRS